MLSDYLSKNKELEWKPDYDAGTFRNFTEDPHQSGTLKVLYDKDFPIFSQAPNPEPLELDSVAIANALAKDLPIELDPSGLDSPYTAHKFILPWLTKNVLSLRDQVEMTNSTLSSLQKKNTLSTFRRLQSLLLQETSKKVRQVVLNFLNNLENRNKRGKDLRPPTNNQGKVVIPGQKLLNAAYQLKAGNLTAISDPLKLNPSILLEAAKYQVLAEELIKDYIDFFLTSTNNYLLDSAITTVNYALRNSLFLEKELITYVISLTYLIDKNVQNAQSLLTLSDSIVNFEFDLQF
jgi:hypothetical protein